MNSTHVHNIYMCTIQHIMFILVLLCACMLALYDNVKAYIKMIGIIITIITVMDIIVRIFTKIGIIVWIITMMGIINTIITMNT